LHLFATCIYNAIQKRRKFPLGFSKGSIFNISKYLDYKLFKKQFDYGLFTKILNQKRADITLKKILFVCLLANPTAKRARFKDPANWNLSKL
jgi:hypothetical protein